MQLFCNVLLLNCNIAADYMPGVTPILNDRDFRRVFIRAMKLDWQNALMVGGVLNYHSA